MPELVHVQLAVFVVDVKSAHWALLASIPVGQLPFGPIALTPDNRFAYVPTYGNSPGSSVFIISTCDNRVVGNITGFAGAQGAAVSPRGSLLYVAEFDGSSIKVISTATNTVALTFRSSDSAHPFNFPGAIALNAKVLIQLY